MSLDAEVAALRASPIFAAVDLPALKRFALAGERFDLDAGESLFRIGDPPSSVYFVLSGRFAVKSGGATVAALGPGEIIGEMGVLCNRARSSTIVAEAPSSVTALSGADFLNIVSTGPASALAMMQMLSERLNETSRMLTAEFAKN